MYSASKKPTWGAVLITITIYFVIIIIMIVIMIIVSSSSSSSSSSSWRMIRADLRLPIPCLSLSLSISPSLSFGASRASSWRLPGCSRAGFSTSWPGDVGWHYLSNATCLMRPRSFYARFVASRITIVCYIIRHF